MVIKHVSAKQELQLTNNSKTYVHLTYFKQQHFTRNLTLVSHQ